MKLILASFAFILASSTAYAADAIVEEPVAVLAPDTFSWTGGYIGVNAGYAGGKFKHPFALTQRFEGDEIEDVNSLGGSLDVTSSGFVGGVQAGYNWQFANGFVLGAEADFQGSTLKGEVSGDIGNNFGNISFEAGTKVQWWGTVRARLGYAATDRFLVYGTGGLAYGKVKSYYDLDLGGGNGASGSSSKTRAGWTVGAGAEYAITNNWTLKSEYLYTDLGKNTIFSYTDEGTDFSVRNNVKFHTVRVGLNYKF